MMDQVPTALAPSWIFPLWLMEHGSWRSGTDFVMSSTTTLGGSFRILRDRKPPKATIFHPGSSGSGYFHDIHKHTYQF